MCISGFSNLIFHLLTGRVSGENCHFRLRSTTSGTHVSFPSTVDNFRYTFRSPQYSFIASYDAKNELKIVCLRRRLCYLNGRLILCCDLDGERSNCRASLIWQVNQGQCVCIWNTLTFKCIQVHPVSFD